MKKEQVTYRFGNNSVFDYYVIEEKKNAMEQDIDPKSLASNFSGQDKIKMAKYAQLPYGNYDILIEIYKKGTEERRGVLLAHYEDVKPIK